MGSQPGKPFGKVATPVRVFKYLTPVVGSTTAI
jgi:hypothetical protein